MLQDGTTTRRQQLSKKILSSSSSRLGTWMAMLWLWVHAVRCSGYLEEPDLDEIIVQRPWTTPPDEVAGTIDSGSSTTFFAATPSRHPADADLGTDAAQPRRSLDS